VTLTIFVAELRVAKAKVLFLLAKSKEVQPSQ